MSIVESLLINLLLLFLVMEKKSPGEYLERTQLPYGGDGLDQAGPDFYDERRHRWICASQVALVSRPRLAGVAGFLRLFPAHAVSTATLFNFFLGIEGSVAKVIELYG